MESDWCNLDDTFCSEAESKLSQQKKKQENELGLLKTLQQNLKRHAETNIPMRSSQVKRSLQRISSFSLDTRQEHEEEVEEVTRNLLEMADRNSQSADFSSQFSEINLTEETIKLKPIQEEPTGHEFYDEDTFSMNKFDESLLSNKNFELNEESIDSGINVSSPHSQLLGFVESSAVYSHKSLLDFESSPTASKVHNPFDFNLQDDDIVECSTPIKKQQKKKLKHAPKKKPKSTKIPRKLVGKIATQKEEVSKYVYDEALLAQSIDPVVPNDGDAELIYRQQCEVVRMIGDFSRAFLAKLEECESTVKVKLEEKKAKQKSFSPFFDDCPTEDSESDSEIKRDIYKQYVEHSADLAEEAGMGTDALVAAILNLRL